MVLGVPEKGRSFIGSRAMCEALGSVSELRSDESAAFRPNQGMRLIPDDECAAFSGDT